MDVVDGNCVLCTKNTDVLNTVFCNQFLGLLKAHYFEVNNDDFKQFSKLFEARHNVHSFCVPCAFKLSCYFETRNACNGATKTGTSGRTCSHCNNTDYVTKCSKQLKTDFQSVFKGIKKNARNITHTCLRCLLAINAFKAIKESITDLLAEDSSSDSSDSEQTTTMKKSKSSKVATPQSLRKRKNSDADNKNENQTSKRLRRDSTRKSIEVVKKGKKSTRRASSALDKKLSHLNNVNAETIERDMHLSYQVVTDQKLMFDIPFVDCAGIESIKSNGRSTRQKSKKLKLSAPDEESVIDISSSDEQEESAPLSTRKLNLTRSERASQRKSQRISTSGNDTETTVSSTLSSSRPKRNVSQKSPAPKTPTKIVNSKKIVIESSDDEAETTSSKRVIPTRNTKKNVPTTKSQKKMKKESAVPIFKTPKIKLKGPVKIQQKEKIKYSCKKCEKVLKMKYMVVLHELEHDCSYSPMISVEKSDLLAIKEDLKLKNRTDDDDKTETNDLATDENTETEKETDTDVAENNEDENLKSLKLVDENEDEEKNASEETDNSAEKEDVANEVDELNEKQDKMDISIEKDVVEETDKEVDDKVEEHDDKISEQDATDITSDKEEEGAGSEKESDLIEDDVEAATPESEKENKVSSDNEEETNDTATESVSQETDEITEEDMPTKEVRSPKKKEKSDVSPKKQDSSKDEVEPEEKTMEAEETTTNEGDQQNASNDEETDAAEKVASPKRKSKTPSPKKQKDSKENGDENNEHDNETTMEVDVDAASKEDVRSPKRASKSPSPKRAKSASPKKADTVDDAEELNAAVAAADEELSKDIPKENDKNLSPISSDNESNTEPNEYVSKGSDISDNEVEQPVDKDQKSNGFSNDCEIDEFTLKLSSSEESNSPDKRNTSDQENESTNNILPDETINSVHKTADQDTFQMVENLLQNLGA